MAQRGRIQACVQEKGLVCAEACLAVTRYVQGGEHDIIPLRDAGTGWETTGEWEYPSVPKRSEQ